MGEFLRRFFQALIAAPTEVVAGLGRILLLLLLLILYLFRILWQLILRLCRGEKEPKDPRHCDELPPHVKRKPDPCLYSQFYLLSQGLDVTWDNPDIWITRPDGTPVDSFNLQPDTDYLVNGRIHDASFDPALATRVRCLYRPWSFNSPDRIPIELNPDGTERIVLLHIPPWQSEVAQFRWHTPNTPDTHYCLQIECAHPDDKNPNNNLGQENTNVGPAPPGSAKTARALLFNGTRERQTYRVRADMYAIREAEVRFRLRRLERPLRRSRPFQGIRDLFPARDARIGLTTAMGRTLKLVSYAWAGFDEVRKQNLRGQQPLREPWTVRVDGQEPGRDGAPVTVDAGQTVEVELTVNVPPGAAPGETVPVNFHAFNRAGKPVGGVTFRIEVQ